MKTLVTGEYSQAGYTIFANDMPVYQAANNPWDSTESLPVGDRDALPIKTIRRHCIRTAKEIAAERAAKYGGVERVDS